MPDGLDWHFHPAVPALSLDEEEDGFGGLLGTGRHDCWSLENRYVPTGTHILENEAEWLGIDKERTV